MPGGHLQSKAARWLRRRGCLCGVILSSIVMFSPACFGKDQTASCVLKGGGHANVIAINDHLELTLADGRVLRIAGIEAPGPTPGDPELAARSREWLADWLRNREIRFDLADERPDRWGRYAAAVFVSPASGDTPAESVAERLIRQGFARRAPDQYKVMCEEQLSQAEKNARAAGLGLWADPYYAVIPASGAAAFAEHAGSIIIAEGQLTGVRDFSARTELLFGPHRRSHLAVTVLQRNLKIFEAAGLHFHELIGQTLRVRGLLETRFGPEIELIHPNDIEVVTSSPDEAVKAMQKAPAAMQP